MPRLRTSFEKPSVFTEVFELLGEVFRNIGAQERAARALGLFWDECSTPFVVRDNGRVVAHVGVLEVPMIMNGERRIVGSVHAVATHPDARRRGFYRAIMNELLSWCDERFETLHLTTDHPEYFEPFGFRIVDEYHFEGPVAGSRDIAKAVPLADRSRLADFLERRTAVSEVFGTYDRDVFLFNEARRPVYFAEDLDVLLSFNIEGGCLKLWDIVGENVPPLQALVDRVPGTFSRVEVHFARDLVDTDSELTAVCDPRSEDVLMARGPYPAERREIKLAPPSRC